MWNSLLWWLVTHKAFVPRTLAFWAHLKKKKVTEKSIVPSQRWYWASPTSDSLVEGRESHRFRYSTEKWTLCLVKKVSFLFNYFIGKRKKKQTFSESEVSDREEEDEADGDGQRDSIIGGGVGIIGLWLLVTGAWLQAFPWKGWTIRKISSVFSTTSTTRSCVISLSLNRLLLIVLLLFHFRRDRFMLWAIDGLSIWLWKLPMCLDQYHDALEIFVKMLIWFYRFSNSKPVFVRIQVKVFENWH